MIWSLKHPIIQILICLILNSDLNFNNITFYISHFYTSHHYSSIILYRDVVPLILTIVIPSRYSFIKCINSCLLITFFFVLKEISFFNLYFNINEFFNNKLNLVICLITDLNVFFGIIHII